MLIRHPRQTTRDLEAWARWEREDSINASLPRMQRLEDRALADLEVFAAAGPCWAAISWGKDSTVLAHLVERIGGIPAAWFKAVPLANPDCDLVMQWRPWGFDLSVIECPVEKDASGELLPDRWGLVEWPAYHVKHPRHIMGIRAGENRERRMRAMRWGTVTANTCAPLSWWRPDDVFAYLHKHGLPVHPAYACTFGGMVDRARVRVDALGGQQGTGHGRAEWERRYYGREIDEAMISAEKK